jgi:hypothetical protein
MVERVMFAFAGIVAFYKGRDYQVQRFLAHVKDAEERRIKNSCKRISINPLYKEWEDLGDGFYKKDIKPGPDEGLIGI